VREEREQHRAEPEPEGSIDSAHALDQPGGSAEESEVGGEADHPELGGDCERRRVRDEARGRAALLRSRLTRDRLAAEADPLDRVVADDLHGQLDAPRAVAREASRGVVLDRDEHDARRANEDHEGRQGSDQPQAA
jgi:hypothetical protein